VSLERNGVSAAMPTLTMIPRASADERHSLMTCMIFGQHVANSDGHAT